MRFLFLFLFPVFLVVLAVYGAGSSLPEKTITIRGVLLPVAQQELWKKVSDFGSMAQWHQKIDSITAIPEPGTQQTLWHVKAAEKQYYTINPTYRLEPDVMQLEIVENSLPYTAQWDVSLMDKTPDVKAGEPKPAPETFVKIVEEAYTPNPFARFFMHYFVGYHSAVEEYLHSLAVDLKAPQAEIRELVA